LKKNPAMATMPVLPAAIIAATMVGLMLGKGSGLAISLPDEPIVG
jgi:hypothetical protein